jgi:hypothetical protein
VISKAVSNKASACVGNYQDSVTAPVSRDHDDGGVAEDEEVEAVDDGTAKAFAIQKVLFFHLCKMNLVIYAQCLAAPKVHTHHPCQPPATSGLAP